VPLTANGIEFANNQMNYGSLTCGRSQEAMWE
jgi:hypothetical protein